MDIVAPQLEFVLSIKNHDESSIEEKIIKIDDYFENKENNKFFPLILKETYFPISLNSLKNLNPDVEDNDKLELLNNLDDQHRQLVMAKDYLWNEIDKCRIGSYREDSEELLKKIKSINRYRRGNVKNLRDSILNRFTESSLELENLWILFLIERMWMSLGLRGDRLIYDYLIFEHVSVVNISGEIYELNKKLNLVQSELQRNMLNFSFSLQNQLLSKKESFKLPNFIINDFKKQQRDKNDIYGTDKYGASSIDDKCFAVMNFNNSDYFSLSGIEKTNINSAFDDFFRKEYGNKYQKVNLTNETRYYYSEYNQYIKYRDAVSKKEVHSRMFSCCEQKLISHIIYESGKEVEIYVKYSPCRICERLIRNVTSSNNKKVKVKYGKEKEGICMSSVVKLDDIARKISK